MKNFIKSLDLKTKRKTLSLIIALLIFTLTGLWTSCDLCFLLHVIPWTIGYAEGMNFSIIFYYLTSIFMLSAIIYQIIRPKE